MTVDAIVRAVRAATPPAIKISTPDAYTGAPALIAEWGGDEYLLEIGSRNKYAVTSLVHQIRERLPLPFLPDADVLRRAGEIRSALRKTRAGGRNGGRRPSPNRCPCGAMTATRAAKRNHICAAGA